MTRQAQISNLENSIEWDILIIGGGASGLGVAVDGASRGFKTVLLESHDFAKGTSSRSTKLVHGGVRYMAQGNIKLVIEALRERGFLAKNAAHLVSKQSFVIPNYSWFKGIFYYIGLSIYDLLAGKRSFGKTKFLSKETTLKLLPNIQEKELRCGVVYYDGQFDDARLAINLMQTAIEKGATAINHIKVVGLIKDDAGKLIGAVAKDQLTEREYRIKAKTIVNATGVFTDKILKLNHSEHKKTIVPSQGVHLVLDKAFMPSDVALMIPKTSDGRVLFAVPWHDKLVLGTTDTLIKKASYEPKALESEINFILATAKKYFSKYPKREDVLAVFAGLRPLAAPTDNSTSTKEVSRSHKILVEKAGLISIVGGKWTTYRQMAEETVNKAITVGKLDYRSCQTHQLSIHGNVFEKYQEKNHLNIYGSDKVLIEKLQTQYPELNKKIHPNYHYTYAEVLWAIDHEMAIDLEDVLSRRVRLLFLDAKAAITVAHEVAGFIAKHRNLPEQWITAQVVGFKNLVTHYTVHNSPKNKL